MEKITRCFYFHNYLWSYVCDL